MATNRKNSFSEAENSVRIERLHQIWSSASALIREADVCEGCLASPATVTANHQLKTKRYANEAAVLARGRQFLLNSRVRA